MRTTITVLAVLLAVAGCRSGSVSDSVPGHVPPRTTSIFGSWVLASDVDSTAFAGASRVELDLAQQAFRITADYPGRAPTVITGSVAAAEGMVTLTPATVSGAQAGRWSAVALVPGQPVTFRASAAGGSLVFAPPGRQLAQPSSVWHRRESAAAAGRQESAEREPR